MKELTMTEATQIMEDWGVALTEDREPDYPLLYRLLTEAEKRKGGSTVPTVSISQTTALDIACYLDELGKTPVWVENLRSAPIIATPATDRKASVLAGALQLGQGQVAFEGIEGMDKELIADCTVEVSLAIHDAVDRAFEGRK